MKRDMDLCRKILQVIEEMPPRGIAALDPGDLGEEYSELGQETLNRHVKIMIGAGFIDTTGGFRRGAPFVKGLTWEGHEFVEKSRDHGLWEKAKELAKEKSGGIAIEIISPLLTSLAKKALGLEA